MITLVITGGIASGKSTLKQSLEQTIPGTPSFDCDNEVAALLSQKEVISSIAADIDSQSVVADQIDKKRLKEVVFQDQGAKRKLEGILHPLIKERLEKSRRKALRSGEVLFVADIPLFFETNWKFDNQCIVLTACPKKLQISRIIERDCVSEDLAVNIIKSQLPLLDKIDRADHVFWTSGNINFLSKQVDVFKENFKFRLEKEREKSGPKLDIEIPEVVELGELRKQSTSELLNTSSRLGLRLSKVDKRSLVFDIATKLSNLGSDVLVEGVLEQGKETYAMIRDPQSSFRPGKDDVYIPSKLLNDYSLRTGAQVKALVRAPRGRDTYLSVKELKEIEDKPVSSFQQLGEFDKLESEFPSERFHLEINERDQFGGRIVDLIAPLGKGQRGIIVAPPRGGKTVLLKQIAKGIQQNHPDAELIVLLLDERPEEVSEFEEAINTNVFSSTFDEPNKRHAQVADLVLERARRQVEQGKNVVILLDSLTRLARGYNNAASGGPIGSGGVNPKALAKARKFFGAARNIVDGGSLTILATCLVETENRMDDVIFEELKGTGNMEIRLDRDLAERRIFPAINLQQSGTRNDDRLYHQEELPKVVNLRREQTNVPNGEFLQKLLEKMNTTKSNAELLLSWK